MNGRYTYRIPPGGTLVIKDDRPLRQWHAESAAYASGTPLSYGGEGAPPAKVALHDLGSTEAYIWYFVGTEAEKRKYVNDPATYIPSRPNRRAD